MSNERYYGNISSPRRARTLGFSAASITLGVGGMVISYVLMQLFGVPIQYAGIAMLVAAVGIGIVETGRKFGRSRVERIIRAKKIRTARKNGSTTYLAGPASTMPDASVRAPGLLASTEMHVGRDHFGREFAYLWDPMKRTGTVFFGANAPGIALQDQDTIDYLVSGWAGYLQQTGQLAACVQISVTVTSRKDAGERLPQAVKEARKHTDRTQIPEFATATVDDIVADVNANIGRTEAHIAVTFSAEADPVNGFDARDRDELMDEVQVHLPAMIEQLELTGAGAVAYLTAQDVIDTAYAAYNPEAAGAVELARLSKEGTGLTWHEVGPVWADANNPDRYEHAGGFSQSFQVWQAPAGVFRENSLAALFAPDGVSVQKRVTIMYRALTAEASQKRVQKAVTDANYEKNQKGRRATGEQQVRAGQAEVTEAEVNRGASLMRFSFAITVTVTDESLLRRVPALVRNACQTGVQLSVRPATGSQDAAFAISLGCGIIPGKHASVPQELREAL